MVLILSIFATGLGLGLRTRWCQLGVYVIVHRQISIVIYLNFHQRLFSRAKLYRWLQSRGEVMAYSRCGANYIRIQGTKNDEFTYKEELICSLLLHFCFLRLVFIVTHYGNRLVNQQ